MNLPLRPSLMFAIASSLMLLPGLSACQAYPPGFAGARVGGAQGPAISGGSMPSVNALSVPICEVLVTSVAAPDKSFVNEDKFKIFLAAGEQKDVFMPALHDLTKPLAPGELDKEDRRMKVSAFGCKKEGYDWAADESATLFEKAVPFTDGQKLVFR